MPFTLTMPKLSPTMEEGTITKWHKKVGDLVKEGDVIFEVATDKATVEHSAIDTAYLRKILVEEEGYAAINEAVAIFTEEKDESIEGYQPEGVVAEVAAEEVAAEAAPTAEAKPAAKAPAGGAMAQPLFVPEPPLEGYEFAFPTKTPEGRTKASPLARKLAQEKGIDLASIKGTGPGERVTSRDLDLGQPDLPVSFTPRETPTIVPGTYEEEALTPIRKIVGQRLQESKTFIPHFYVQQEIRVDRLVAVREELKNNGLKVSFNDFIVRAAALSLREHPNVNSGFNTGNNTIIRFQTIDISIAVTIEGGLITPIVRHADYKNVGELATEIKLLAGKAHQGKLAREEYTGGSFTVSNLGMFGTTAFAAVINPPQAAILAVGGIEEKGVVDQGQVRPGKTMQLVLSVDHRVIDGSEAAIFMGTVKKYLENPSTLLLV